MSSNGAAQPLPSGSSSPSPSTSNASASTGAPANESRWKAWGRKAFDKSIVVSDWAAGYANAGSAKIGGERFFPKSNDFDEEVLKCERILRAFTVEGIAADVQETEVPDGKGSFMKKKRKVLRKIPPHLIKRAKGIVIYTSMRSGIAPLGGAGGVGLMLARMPDGSWSPPSSVSPNNFAVGFLLGFDIFDAILLVNTDAAMQKFKGHKVTLGAETAVAAGPFGAGISGEMGLDRTPVYSYVRSRGLYAGVEAMAQAFLHRFDENERVYYWPGITATDIFEGKVRMPPNVEPLLRALRDAETGIAQGDSLERTVYESINAPPNPALRAIQGRDSSDVLEDGEKLKLPPTPEELEAMEEAGIPDEYDIALEKKLQQEKIAFEKREREEIFSLPPPPRHPHVLKYNKERRLPPLPPRAPPVLLASASDDDATATLETTEQNKETATTVPTERMQEVSLLDQDDDVNKDDAFPPSYDAGVSGDAAQPVVDEKKAHPDDETDAQGQASDKAQNKPEDDAEQLEQRDLADKARETDANELDPVAVQDKDAPADERQAKGSVATSEAGSDNFQDAETIQETPAAETSQEAAAPAAGNAATPSRPPRARPPRTRPVKKGAVAKTETPKLLVVLDWDETISAADTLALIAPPAGTQEHGPEFDHYTEAYLADLSTHEAAFGERDTVERQLEYLNSLEKVEKASLTRIQDGGLFRGMKEADLLSRAEQVAMRDGWRAADEWLVGLASQGTLEADVISVGWSAKFIRRAIEAFRQREGYASSETVPRGIYANEVEMDDEHVATGRIVASPGVDGDGMRIGEDKAAQLRKLKTSTQAQRTVYIGDSNTDLPCLLEAEYGLVIGGKTSTKETIERVGLADRCIEAQEWLKSGEAAAPSGATLITVGDWTEALAVLQKLSGNDVA